MRALLIVLASLLSFGATTPPASRYSCHDYMPKLDRHVLTIPPGHTDSLSVTYWTRFAGDSVPTKKLPGRCAVEWVQVPEATPAITLTPDTGAMKRYRVYVTVAPSAVAAPVVATGITANVFYQ